LAKAGKNSKRRVTVKDMKFRNDPMIRLYERTQDWLQERGRPVVIILGIIAGLLVLYTAGYYFFSYRDSKAAQAFAQAFEKYNAPVLDAASTNQAGKYYTDEKMKWQESAEAFERLAEDYSGRYGAVGRYYAGVSYLHIDRDKGVRMLQEAVNKDEQPTSDLARFALAENSAAGGETERAIQDYERLLNSPYVPRQAIQFGLGRIYEKSGDAQKAVDFYFEAAKVDRATSAGSEAEKRLAALAPERLKELPPPNTSAPTGL
jgi:tetratricopeptide (TPR) repeat protein